MTSAKTAPARRCCPLGRRSRTPDASRGRLPSATIGTAGTHGRGWPRRSRINSQRAQCGRAVSASYSVQRTRDGRPVISVYLRLRVRAPKSGPDGTGFLVAYAAPPTTCSRTSFNTRIEPSRRALYGMPKWSSSRFRADVKTRPVKLFSFPRRGTSSLPPFSIWAIGRRLRGSTRSLRLGEVECPERR